MKRIFLAFKILTVVVFLFSSLAEAKLVFVTDQNTSFYAPSDPPLY